MAIYGLPNMVLTLFGFLFRCSLNLWILIDMVFNIEAIKRGERHQRGLWWQEGVCGRSRELLERFESFYERDIFEISC